MENVKIKEISIPLENGEEGQIAILIYNGEDYPVEKLDWAVSEYVGTAYHYQFVDKNMDNPCVRIIIPYIEGIKLENFDPTNHKLKLL